MLRGIERFDIMTLILRPVRQHWQLTMNRAVVNELAALPARRGSVSVPINFGIADHPPASLALRTKQPTHCLEGKPSQGHEVHDIGPAFARRLVLESLFARRTYLPSL
ncbi:MAG TPA: hypothetical protein VI488_07670 [Candidatus Angelobacter sp.]